jgi:hypothetical protein
MLQRERYVLTTGEAELIGLISSCAKLELVIQDLKSYLSTSFSLYFGFNPKVQTHL